LKLSRQLKNKKIYLISPTKVDNKIFYSQLRKVLSFNNVSIFQLRLKQEKEKEKFKIGKKIRKITKKYKVKLLINDSPLLAKKLKADGCHLGQKDAHISKARKILGFKKIIGVTCHNSKKLVSKAVKLKADYIALGSFFKTKTKKVKHKATLNVLKWCKKTYKITVVAIGGINNNNYKKLLLNQADFLAISGYVWNNKKLKPEQAIQNF
tara:strand:+ start:1048 stop:1674 length:627 start_codon:yes stop_codon:yes gene_type:complete